MQGHDDRGLDQAAAARLTGEHRSKKRYAIDLPLTYRIREKPFVVNGHGRTIDMSSSGIAFTSDEYLNVGTHIELSISWPILLDHTCPLKLFVEGKLVRKTENRTAMVIERLEFRTQGRLRGAGSKDS